MPINAEEQRRIMNMRRINTVNRRNLTYCRRRPLPPPPITLLLEKITANLPMMRSGETRSMREMVTNTCFYLKGICQFVRTFADEMESLLTSVETIAPVVENALTSYTRSIKNKENPEKKQEPTDMNQETTATSENIKDASSSNLEKDQTPPSSISGKMPTEAELKEFLNNPLVAALMQMVAKNLAAKK